MKILFHLLNLLQRKIVLKNKLLWKLLILNYVEVETRTRKKFLRIPTLIASSKGNKYYFVYIGEENQDYQPL